MQQRPHYRFCYSALFPELSGGGAAVRLGQMMQQNPTLCLRDVWRDLDDRYGGDSQAQEKAKWLGIRLIKTGSKYKELQLKDWEKFEAEFNAQKIQVRDRSPSEEFNLIFAQLPGFFQTKVTAEEKRLEASQFWVRVSFPVGEDPGDVLWELEQVVQQGFKEARMDSGSLLIDCAVPLIHSALLSLDGSGLGGDVDDYKI